MELVVIESITARSYYDQMVIGFKSITASSYYDPAVSTDSEFYYHR